MEHVWITEWSSKEPLKFYLYKWHVRNSISLLLDWFISINTMESCNLVYKGNEMRHGQSDLSDKSKKQCDITLLGCPVSTVQIILSTWKTIRTGQPNWYDCGAIAQSIKLYWLAAHKNFDLFSFQKVSNEQSLKSKRWLWEHLKNVIVNRDISYYKDCPLEINNFLR